MDSLVSRTDPGSARGEVNELSLAEQQPSLVLKYGTRYWKYPRCVLDYRLSI